MKKFLMGAVGLLALGMAAPASAADMAVKAPPPAPRSGDLRLDRLLHRRQWRLGLRAATVGISLTRVGVAFADGCRERSGGVIGGQIGYRWQASQWVFGLEAQGDWADLSNQRVSLFDPPLSTSHQNRWHRPLYRPDRLRLECSAALRKGRRGGDQQPL